MAGLLGDSWDDPKTMAVLNLAAGLMGGGNFGQAMARGLAGYQDTMASAKKQALLDEQMQWKRDEINREKAERERTANIERLIKEQFLPITGSQAIGMDGAGPTPEKAQVVGQTRPINFQQLAAQGVPFERLKQLAESANLGRTEVARTVKGIGPDGREYEYQVDKYGQKVGDGMAQFRAPVMQDLGGQVAALDPYNLNQIAQFKKSMSPDAQASNAVAWANNAISRERLNFDKAGGAGGKYQFNADAGGFISPPTPQNPAGSVIPLPGFQKPLNDAQSKALLFGTRMQEADKIMQDLATGGTTTLPVGMNAPFVGPAINAMSSTGSQQLNQAQRDFINAVLRRESGASIADSEFDSAAKQYFPQIGDSPKVVEQKNRARQIAIQGILAEVPPGTKPITVPEKPATGGMAELPPANAGNKGRVIKDQQTGQRLRSNGMQWVPE